jgi:broad specificity phosphatase PhoE
MATRLILLCAGATASSRVGGFPAPDEPLDAGGVRRAAAFRLPPPRPATLVASPSRAAIETARLLGHEAHSEPLLADLDYGHWAGADIDTVRQRAADRLAAWLCDPTQATPGGERPPSLVARVGAWIDRGTAASEDIIAVCHAAVMRAAMSYALDMPLAAAMRIDIAPLTTMTLSHHGRWRLQELRRDR